MIRVASVALAVMAMAACKRSPLPASDAGVAAELPSSSPPSSPPAQDSLLDRVRQRATLADAFAFARPNMNVTVTDNKNGALVFAAWAAERMTWSDVAVAKNETTPGVALKDVESALGKRMCLRGRVDYIRAMPVPGSAAKVFGSFVRVLDGEMTREMMLLAVGSTGDIADGSAAQFCGVVSGLSQPTAGADSKLTLVGLFDLPENRTAARK